MHAGPVFVGRQRELAELRAGLEDAVGGRGRFFLVVGEAGIGKTRLAEELAREAAERGGVALWGRCWEGEGAPPYWPWVQVIRALLQGVPAEELRPAVGAGAPYLVPLVPELGERFRDLPALSTSPRSEHARFYLFDAVATLLRSAAQRTPLVLVLDDLQWADAPSLLLLQFLAHELRDVRILLLGTYREVEVRQAPAVAEILGALGRDGHHVPLRGLGEEEVRRFLEETIGRSPAPVLVRAVHRETEGNPFFVDEIVRLLVAERALERHEDPSPGRFPVPQGVREAIRRRLAPLPPPAREALALASVVGREFDLAILHRACGLDPEALLETLGPALAREIVVREPGGVGRYRFAHALIRETLYEELGPAERIRLHGQIGEVLEEVHRTDPTPHLTALAHHFLEAAPARDGDPGLRAQLLARLAINLYWAPEPERVVALSEEAVRLARQLGDPRLLAAVLRARWIALWRPEGAAERLAIADEILHLGERTGDRELALLGHRFRIVGFLEHGDVVATDREIEAWAQIAGELRKPLTLTVLAVWRATRAIMDGRFADGEEQAQRAVELGQREPDVQPILRHEIQTFLLHFHKGCLDQLVGRPQPRTGVPATMFQRCARAFVWSETGRQAEARRELSALAKEGFPLPRDGAWVVSMSLLSAVAAELNDRTSAAQLYELLMPYAGRVRILAAGLACWGSVSYHLGLLASTLGRVADAIRHYEDAATVHERMGARPFLAWTQLAHARLLLTRDAGARRGEAAAPLTSALATARELAMDGLVAKVRRLGLDAAPTAGAQAPADGEAVFRNEGDVWAVIYAGTSVRLKHSKGLGDIAILLANRGRDIHVADLIAASAGAPPDPRSTPAADLVAQGLRVSRGASGDAVLDHRARADYRERLAGLHRELEDAERCNDEGRVARARAEFAFIAGELASAFGLGGRGRRAGSPIERARKAVASRIRFSLAHIARVHPALASHLRRYIRTGTVCSYVVPDEPVRWRV